MRQHYLPTTPTRSMRGALECTFGRWAGTAIWVLFVLFCALTYPAYWLARQVAYAVQRPFDEASNWLWITLITIGAVAGFISMAGLWTVLLDTLRLIGGAQ